MSDGWHYQSGDVAKGPISARELAELYRTGGVGEYTYVFHETLGEWTEAKQAIDKIVAAGAQSLDSAISTMDGGTVTLYFLKDGINYGPCQGGRPQIISLIKQGTFTRDTLTYVVGSGIWEQLNDATWGRIQKEIDSPTAEPSPPTSLKERVENYARENRLFFDAMCAMVPVWIITIMDVTKNFHGLPSSGKYMGGVMAAFMYVCAFSIAPYKKWYRNAIRMIYMYFIFISMTIGPLFIRSFL